VYLNPKTGDRITIHALNKDMIPKYRTFRSAGGKRKYKRISAKATRRKVIIVAKSSRAKNKKQDVVDDELDELEELEDLDDLEDEDEDDEPEDEGDEDEDEDEDDDEEDDEDELDDLSVKELRAKAREDGHEPSAIRGLKKQGLIDLINEGVDEEDEEDEDEEDDEEEEAPPKRRSSKSKASTKKKSTGSRNRQTDGTVGVQELAEATGKDGRSIRMYLRKNSVAKNEDTGRYEWPSTKNREFLKLVKAIKAGASDRARKEQLDNLKSRKGKSAGAKRSKSSGKSTGTTKKRRSR